jgi:ribosomal protein L11 methyltransferase
MNLRFFDDRHEILEPFIEHQGERRGFWLRKPRKVGERILLARKGTSLRGLPGDRVVVFLDVKSAFGTGGHGTTEGCLVALEKIVRGGETVLDVGTGTGILAVAARKLGAGCVTAVDIDREACLETERNLAANGIEEGIEVVRGGVESVAERFDVVVANLRTPILVSVLDDLSKRLRPGGIAILSGILERELHPFLPIVADRSLALRETFGICGWMTLLLRSGTAGEFPGAEDIR